MANDKKFQLVEGMSCLVASLWFLLTVGSAWAQNPVPLINQPLAPSAVNPAGGAFTLTVNGTGFVPGAFVEWNGSGRATTFVSGSQLAAGILASDTAKPSTDSVAVVNPGPGGGTSNTVFFEVTISSPSMALSAPTDFSLSAGSSPAFGVAADFNADGKLDLAVADQSNGNVSVLLGNGNGTFQAHVDYATGRTPISIALGDFNLDGKVDLAVTNESDNTVSVLLGNGDGTFRAAVSYGTGSSPFSVAVGDFNRDGKMDLAVTNKYSNNVSVLIGNGDGTFQAAVNYDARTQPISVAVGDFNRDSKLDLVLTNFSSKSVSVLLGNGDGTFQAAVDYATGSGPDSVSLADFNGDGDLDLAVANSYSNNVSMLLGNGDGTFQAAVNYPVAQGPNYLVVSDLNGDGKLDLVAATIIGNSVSVLLGNGDGTLQPHLDYGVNQPVSAVVGDFDGDGRPDVAVTGVRDVVEVVQQIPIIWLSKTSLTFADQSVGTSSGAQTVTLTNTSGFTLTLGGVAVTGTNAGDFEQTNDCGSGLLPRHSCTLTVTFTPSQLGPRSAFVAITDDATGSPQQIALGGTGVVSGPNATLTPASLIFPTQPVGTASATQTATLSNYGTVALSISSIVTGGDFQVANTCGLSLAAGASCTITVTFKPTEIGTRTATLSITDNAPSSPHTATLSGTGTVVKFNPASLTFSTRRGYSSTLTTTLTNTGNSTLTVTNITSLPNPPFSETNTCGASVGAGKSCTISVTFTPSPFAYRTYNYSGAVWVSDNGGGSPQQVPLMGLVRIF